MSGQTPSIGRVVHYVLKEGRSHGQHRSALVVNVFGSVTHVNLLVALDGINDTDNEFNAPQIGNAYSVPEDQNDKAPGTWHWPEYVK